LARSDPQGRGDLPPDIAVALGAAGSRLGLFAGQVTWFRSLGSTNDLLLGRAVSGAPEGTVIVAGAQTAGRGRLGRTWHSPEGAGLYVSVLLRPSRAMVALLTLAAGVAIADGLHAVTGLDPALKWPNDLWVGQRKLGGILAEGTVTPGAPAQVVVGFGLNLMRAALPPDVAGRATSLEEETGRPAERGEVLAACLGALARRYGQLATDPAGVLDAWRVRARPLMGRRVEWDSLEGLRSGVSAGVDEDGALRVQTASGVERIIAGEVRWM